VERHHAGLEDDPYCRIINALDGERGAARARAYAEPAQRTRDSWLCAAVIAAPFSDETLRALPPARLLFLRPEVEDVLNAEVKIPNVCWVAGSGHFMGGVGRPASSRLQTDQTRRVVTSGFSYLRAFNGGGGACPIAGL